MNKPTRTFTYPELLYNAATAYKAQREAAQVFGISEQSLIQALSTMTRIPEPAVARDWRCLLPQI